MAAVGANTLYRQECKTALPCHSERSEESKASDSEAVVSDMQRFGFFVAPLLRMTEDPEFTSTEQGLALSKS